MTCHYLNIEEKHRQGPGDIASIADFTTSPGEEIDAERVLSNPNTSLYCFNEATKNAIFTELADGVNLASVPFVYMAQYEQAQRLIEMDYETFKRVARTLPPVEHLLMIYITGRSGSTLLSHVFNEVDDVMSLSEPDVGTQFLHLRASGMTDAELSDLLDSTVRILFKPTPFKTPSIYALKLRSEATQLMDLYQATFPTVKNLYLYRDAVGFVASFYRVLMADDNFPDLMPFNDIANLLGKIVAQDFTTMRTYLQPETEQVTVSQWLTLWWIKIVEWYLEYYAQGIPVLAINYPDLNQKREVTLKAIFDYCGLPSGRIAETLHVFERDSQAGTVLARENPTEGNKFKLSDAELDEMRRILAQHPVIKTPDYVVPGTPTL